MFVSPAVVGKTVLVGSCAGSLYALERTSGSPIWLYDTRADGVRAQFHGEPLLLRGRIVVPSDSDPKGHLYSIDAASGDLIWKIPFDQGVATTPLLVDDHVIAVSVKGNVVAVDPRDGKFFWTVRPAGTLEPLPFIQSPAFASRRIFVADNIATTFALDSSTGRTLWQKKLPARTSTALVVAGKTLIFGTADGYINWLSIASGNIQRRVRLEEGQPYGTPVVASPLLFVLAAGDKGDLLALDAKTGVLRWKQQTSKEWTTYRPLLTGSTVIVGSTEKDLCAFDRETGERLWCRSIAQVPRGLGVSDNGVLYVGSLSGVVQALPLPRSSRDHR